MSSNLSRTLGISMFSRLELLPALMGQCNDRHMESGWLNFQLVSQLQGCTDHRALTRLCPALYRCTDAGVCGPREVGHCWQAFGVLQSQLGYFQSEKCASFPWVNKSSWHIFFDPLQSCRIWQQWKEELVPGAGAFHRQWFGQELLLDRWGLHASLRV